MEIIWTEFAITTYEKEIDFILLKWNSLQVQKFVRLVDRSLLNLKNQTDSGKLTQKENVFVKVVSKQTSIIFRVDEKRQKIFLLRFWNNQQNPNELEQFFKGL